MIDKEEKIKEMAFNLIMATSPLGVKDLTKEFDYKTVATDLYNLYGWRKERQGEWRDVLEEEMYCPDFKTTIIRTRQTCSHCRTRIGFIGQKRYLFDDYCPNCGARMKGE